MRLLRPVIAAAVIIPFSSRARLPPGQRLLEIAGLAAGAPSAPWPGALLRVSYDRQARRAVSGPACRMPSSGWSSRPAASTSRTAPVMSSASSSAAGLVASQSTVGRRPTASIFVSIAMLLGRTGILAAKARAATARAGGHAPAASPARGQRWLRRIRPGHRPGRPGARSARRAPGSSPSARSASGADLDPPTVPGPPASGATPGTPPGRLPQLVQTQRAASDWTPASRRAAGQLDDLASGVAVAGQADPVDRGRAGWCRRGRRRGQRDCDAADQRGHAGCPGRPPDESSHGDRRPYLRIVADRDSGHRRAGLPPRPALVTGAVARRRSPGCRCSARTGWPPRCSPGCRRWS